MSNLERTLRRLDHLVQSNPRRAIVEASALLESPEPRASVHAWATVGRSLYELGDMTLATDAMRHALRSCDAIEQDDLVVRIRMSAAAVFAEMGEVHDALVQLAAAEHDSLGAIRGRVRTQRALVLCHAGRLPEALRESHLADADLRRTGDHLGRLRLLANQSLIHLQLGELDAAAAGLLKAHRLAQRMDQSIAEALMVANLGVVHARAGRTFVALQHFDRARAQYVAAGKPLRTLTILEIDRAETLLRAGLFADAISAGRLAVSHAHASGNKVAIGDAELVLARAQLSDGKLRAARRTALSAASTLHRGGRTATAMHGRAIALHAMMAATDDAEEAIHLLARARRVAIRLDRDGWRDSGDDLRAARLKCALRLDLMTLVGDDMRALRQPRPSERPGSEVRRRYADALFHWQLGDALAAMRAARAGMRTLDRHREGTEGFEQRVGVAATGSEVAALGTRIALESGRPGAVLAWAERTRVNAFPLPTLARPGHRAIPSLRSIAQQLGSGVLVEFVLSAGQIFAVVVRRHRSALIHVGPLDRVALLSDQLRSWLQRAAAKSPAHAGSGRAIAARLDEALLAPLGLRQNDDVVVIPHGPLHAVPWASLPRLAQANFCTNASAAIWLDSERRSSSAGRAPTGTAGLVVGPDVAGGPAERRAVQRIHPHAVVAAGRQATRRRTAALLRSCDMLHIAAHGEFRPEHPLQSALRLYDGELTLTDLGAIDVGARLVVLSSCEGGAHGVTSGSEVLGLGLQLISGGALAVVAPTVVVSDELCAGFIADFHRAWAAGAPVASALASARQQWTAPDADHARWAVASAFVCSGAGSLTPGSLMR